MLRTIVVFAFVLGLFVTLTPTRSGGLDDGVRLAARACSQPAGVVGSLQPCGTMKLAAGPYIQPTGVAVNPDIEAA